MNSKIRSMEKCGISHELDVVLLVEDGMNREELEAFSNFMIEKGLSLQAHSQQIDDDSFISLEGVDNIRVICQPGFVSSGEWKHYAQLPMRIFANPDAVDAVNEEHDKEFDSHIEKICMLISEGWAAIVA